MSLDQKALSSSNQIAMDAVIGSVDIHAEFNLSKAVDMWTNFELRQRLHMVARERAAENQIRIAGTSAEGFLFIANANPNCDWRVHLAWFCRQLMSDFEIILASVFGPVVAKGSVGLRFGISSGQIVIGRLSEDSSEVSLVGPEVQFALHLRTLAKTNEIVFSSRVWRRIKRSVPTWNSEERAYFGPEGIDDLVPAVHASCP